MSAYPQCYQENKYSLPIPDFKNVVNDKSINPKTECLSSILIIKDPKTKSIGPSYKFFM